MPPKPRAAAALESFGNFVTVVGALLLFNGFFMTILGFMTVLGITTENSPNGTRSTSPPSSPISSGLLVLGIGLAVFVIGRVLAKSGKRRA